MSAGRHRLRSAGVRLLLLGAAIALGGGCASEPLFRQVPTHLGRDARIVWDRDGDEEEPAALVRSASGVLSVPLRPGPQAVQRERFEITEPRKPPLVLELTVHVDPEPAVEDGIHLDSSANVQIVKTAAKGVGGRYATGPLTAYPEPLDQLRDPGGGPWFLPREGQGIVLTIDAASGEGASAFIGGVPRLLAAQPDGTGFTPLVAHVEPGVAEVRVERPGYQALKAAIDVEPGVYTLISVRLAEERVP